MRMTDLIAKKRDGGCLSAEEIAFFVKGCTDESIPDYQVSAMLMAMYLKGLEERETTDLTLAMAKSGDMLDLSPLGNKTADKHSTGGVGDKTTLVVAPVVAALGCTVAKMSGRGLGFTGGTIDKLEAIPGFKTQIKPEEFTEIARGNGLSVVGQSGNLAPADKRLYALRDVTATVDCLPLIASSIMSKKLAAGAKNIVLDVKYGNGAFMKTPDDAQKLAEEMLRIGKDAGRNMAAVITDMNIPLGKAVGNALEVAEAVQVLRGKGPQDLYELCVVLAAELVHLCTGDSVQECTQKVQQVLQDGSAFEKLCTMVRAQGGDDSYLIEPERFAKPGPEKKIFSASDGFIAAMDCATVGKAAMLSGAGRETKADIIDFSAGILLEKKTGDSVKKGDLLATVYGANDRIAAAASVLEDSYVFSKDKPNRQPLVYKVLTNKN